MLEVRLSTEQDVDQLIAFLQRPLIDESFVPPLSQRAQTIEMRVHTKTQIGFWLIAVQNGRIVGCRGCNGVVDVQLNIVEFSTLVVDPALRRRGVGARLLTEATVVARRNYDPAVMRFDSWCGNIAVERVARKLGFRKSQPYEDSKRPLGVMSVTYTWTKP